MTIQQIIRAIDDGIEVEAQGYWANCEQNEFIVIAQREGIQKAIDEINELAI